MELDFLEQLTGVGLGGGGERWLGGSGTSGEEKFSRSLMKGERKGHEIFGFSSFSCGMFFFWSCLDRGQLFQRPRLLLLFRNFQVMEHEGIFCVDLDWRKLRIVIF